MAKLFLLPDDLRSACKAVSLRFISLPDLLSRLLGMTEIWACLYDCLDLGHSMTDDLGHAY